MSYSVGNVVVLSSHPYFQSSDKESIFISGDVTTLSPLMIIIETLKEGKSVFDENTDIELVKRETFQCKCIWYSNKSGHYDEIWLSSRLLRIIGSNIFLEYKDLPYGTPVVLKTLSIELGKKKKSLKYSSDSFQDSNKVITGLLPFSSPVMQVIGTAKNDCKEPFLDSKTGKVKRLVSSQLIKCKYYNSISDKFSEVLIPIEALEKIYVVSHKYITDLTKAINDKCFYRCFSQSPLFLMTIVKPTGLIYKSGNYFLEANDYLQNSHIEILITGEENQFEAIDEKFFQLPNFEAIEDKLQIEWLDKDTIKNLPQGNLWRIKYKDFNDKITVRTIFNVSYFDNIVEKKQ